MHFLLLFFASNADINAQNDYNSYSNQFTSATQNCKNNIKRYICSAAFVECESDGSTKTSCQQSCSNVVSSCGSDQCLLDNCNLNTPCASGSMTVVQLGLIVMSLIYFLI